MTFVENHDWDYFDDQGNGVCKACHAIWPRNGAEPSTRCPRFKPGDVSLAMSFPPLCATMGKSEREAAATLIVRVLQLRGDGFGAVTPRECGDALKRDRESMTEPLASLAINPFWRPDFRDLVAQGFARWTNDDAHAPIELTEKGIDALRKCVPWEKKGAVE